MQHESRMNFHCAIAPCSTLRVPTICVTLAANCLFCSSSRRFVAGLGYAFMPQPVEVDLVKVERGTVRVTVDRGRQDADSR